MDSLVKNSEDNFLKDSKLDSFEEGFVRDRPPAKKAESLSGDQRARELSSKDEYKLSKINTLDVLGWLLTFVVFWAIYTIYNNLYTYFYPNSESFVSSTEVQAQDSSSLGSHSAIIPDEEVGFALKEKAFTLLRLKERKKNSQALINAEKRIRALTDFRKVDAPREAVAEEEDTGFSLGRALQGMLMGEDS